MTKGVAILGATGSIGIHTLDVIKLNASRYRVIALTAHKAVDRLFEQCQQFQPQYAVMLDETAATQLQQRLMAAGSDVQVLSGQAALAQVVSFPQVDVVVAGIVGAAGLLPTLAAAKAGKRILLANKEALVMSGALFMQAVQAGGAELLPIDSEHNAIFQCLPQAKITLSDKGVKKIWLTASGGPFRTWATSDLVGVTPEQAVAHPNWVMGPKVSIDSATLMNKGLEVIEAYWLFGAQVDQIEVILHPQSAVHSLVEYEDGAVLAELGNPDMRTPIAHALAWPERVISGVNTWDVLLKGGHLNFEPVDRHRFPCIRLAYEALRAGGTATTILNAANEVAVSAFMARTLRFIDIPTVLESVLAQISAQTADRLDVILSADGAARQMAQEVIARGHFS